MPTDADWLEAMPEIYDECLGPALFAPFAERTAADAAALAPRRVLEIAAGTGILTAALAAALPAAEITATDLNPAMVARGAARVPGATWLAADAQRLDLPTGRYDLVACQFGAMFFPDKPAAFAEMARVLRPGGTVLLSSWDEVAASALPAAMQASLHAVLPDPPDFIVRIPHGYRDPDRIAADLAAGGLVRVAVERVVLRGRPMPAAEVTRGFCYGTPLRFQLAEHGPLPEITERLKREMAARLGPEPVSGDLAAFLVTARAPD